MTKTIENTEDVLDIRDIFERIEELETEIKEVEESFETSANVESLEEDRDELQEELNKLTSFVGEFEGNGGDEEWRGSWYPVTLIRESYFTDYAEEFVKDCGYISNDLPSWIEIDWEATAENIKVDYSEGEFDGVIYLAR